MSRQLKAAVLFLASFCFFSAHANVVAIQKNSSSIVAVKYDVFRALHSLITIICITISLKEPLSRASR